MKKHTGYTLIELVIAMLIGLIVVAAAISIYIATVQSSSSIVKSARLNYDFDSTLALMVNDIRRAGYWGGASVGADSRNNPFTQTAAGNYTDLQIPSKDCILYTYDANSDTNVGNSEYFGFRLNGSNIQMRSTNVDCSNQNGWDVLNISQGNQQINITTLAFGQSYKCLRKRPGVVDQSYTSSCAAVAAGTFVSGDRLIETRNVTINLAGTVNTDQTIIKKMPINTATNLTAPYEVKVRNDRIYSIP